jgi:hypothetical protein
MEEQRAGPDDTSGASSNVTTRIAPTRNHRQRVVSESSASRQRVVNETGTTNSHEHATTAQRHATTPQARGRTVNQRSDRSLSPPRPPIARRVPGERPTPLVNSQEHQVLRCEPRLGTKSATSGTPPHRRTSRHGTVTVTNAVSRRCLRRGCRPHLVIAGLRCGHLGSLLTTADRRSTPGPGWHYRVPQF